MRKTRLTRIWFLAALPIVLLTILLVVSYASAYWKANSLLVAANHIADPGFDDTAFVSADDYAKLVIVPKDVLADDEIYPQVKTKNHFVILGLNRIKIISDIEVQIVSSHDPSKNGTWEGKVELVMAFSGFRWEVVSVQSVPEDGLIS